jgi:hypothetical protein
LRDEPSSRWPTGAGSWRKAGDYFYVPPGHDSRVIGEEPYISLHIMGGENYTA